jgi:UDP:flavonoid glycosyltransferase YjiC (YdhE family)
MMNVLVTTLGSYGDVYPKVGLALQLKRRGHTVTLLTNPYFENLARKYALDFAPIGTIAQFKQFSNHPDLFDPRKSVAVFFDSLILPNIRSAYQSLSACIQPSKTVMVSSILVFGARLVQEKKNVPNVTVHLAPMAFKSAYEMPKNAILSFPNWVPIPIRKLYWWVADKAITDRVIAPELNAFRKELGMPSVSRIMTRWGNSPQRVIGFFPSWFASPQPDWPPVTRLTGFPLFDEDEETILAPEVKAFLEEGESPIVLMPGSLMQQAEPLLDTAVQACQALNKRAIILSRYREQIPKRLPQTIRYFEYIPLRQLLPQASALVHHGGIGTCAQALNAGLPQLLHPMAYDQMDNAWRIRRLGVGDWIPIKNWQVSTVVEKLQMLTTSSTVRDHCQGFTQKIKETEPLIETCKLIEAML